MDYKTVSAKKTKIYTISLPALWVFSVVKKVKKSETNNVIS